MKKTSIEIVSFVSGLANRVRLRLTLDIINNSTADILLFSGYTIGFVNDIKVLKESIQNKHTEVILELENINSDKIKNCLYRLTKGELKSLYTNQLFSTSGEIEGNYELGDRFLYELETKRSFKINDLKIIVFQCGELNILKNFQGRENKVEFRLSSRKDLKNRFDKLLQNTKIILNPMHTPMGNQGKMKKRREYLSKNKRYYFSTSNTKENSTNLKLSSQQYAYFNGKPLKEVNQIFVENAVSRIFEI
jgi:hypothetical protein